jgi:ADP-ribosylglycohydrolase
MSPPEQRRQAIRRSALWAAYGDALGFITEFADSAGVERRTGDREVRTTVAWRRRVGGQFGVQAELPAGAISDDTQLRLATCRAMLPDGTFDVEAFSKVELVVWSAYALGAGRGSRAAAAHLARRDTTWASNFFSGKGTEYSEGGGNGAAMRVQPHVWASGERSQDDVLHDVLANAITTHGHARGFLGAYFHACCLHIALVDGRVPEPADWRAIVANSGRAAELLRADTTVHDLWIGPWERRSSRTLEQAVTEVAEELMSDIEALRDVRPEGGLGALRTAVERLRVYAPEQRGSGTKTSLLAAAAAWIFAEDPSAGVLACANALGTDTDTVATMAGALLGALADRDPEGALQDAQYIAREADRMWGIGAGRSVPSFPFVDLLAWTPPRSQSDVVGRHDGGLAVAGLGPAQPYGDTWPMAGREAAEFGWMTLWFGQSVLPKRRPEPPALEKNAVVHPEPGYVAGSLEEMPLRAGAEATRRATPARQGGRQRFRTPAPRSANRGSGQRATEAVNGEVSGQRRSRVAGDDLARALGAVAQAPSMNALTDIVIRSGFAPEVVGAGLLRAINGDGSELGIERAVTYAGIIAKARQARRDSGWSETRE